MLSRARCDSAVGGDRQGMTFIEVVVAMAIVVLIGGLVMPQVVARMNQGQSAALASNLDGLRQAIIAFRSDTGRYPRRLSYLGTAIRPTSRDACGVAIPDSSTWKGPYIDRATTAAGITVGAAVIADSLRRNPSTISAANRVGTLTIVATGVDREAALHLEAAVDGNDNLSAGTVQWSTTNDGQLSYAMVIRGC